MPSLPLRAVSPDLTGLTVIGSDGVEICCLVTKGRETHRSLACDFHAVAFALRLVVGAFANRERDLPRRKCVAANDQNFPRFVTPHDVRVQARNAETLRGGGGTFASDGTRAANNPARRSRGTLSLINFGPPFPACRACRRANARRIKRNTNTGAIPEANSNMEATQADEPALVLIPISEARIQEVTLRLGRNRTPRRGAFPRP